jgi:small-conductance mechanosensitive channel
VGRPVRKNARGRMGRRRLGAGGARRAAGRSLRGFRQATIIAVALTAFLLLFLAPAEVTEAQETSQPAASAREASTSPSGAAAAQVRDPDDVIPAAAEEARRSFRRLRDDFFASLPKLIVAVVVLLLTILIARLANWAQRRVLGDWQRAAGVRALVAIAIWAIAIGVLVSIVAGDARALVGSLGLIGLALSWALQTPIESFTGWLLNSFRSYYRVGDRIEVGEVFGDVYSIDFLNTTVWEIGKPSSERGFVHAEQPTGRLITFPNNEVLAGSIVNLTRDFPWVWDEYAVAIANESDLRHAVDVVRSVARRVLAGEMEAPAAEYETILQRAGLVREIAREPEVFVSTTEWSTDLTIRYLVDARQRRLWKSRLITDLTLELAAPEHAGRIIPAYPRRQLQIIDAAGHPEQPLPKSDG